MSMERQRVARSYFLGWFFFDAVSSFPIDVFLHSKYDSDSCSVRSASARSLKLLRLLRLAKLFRLLRVGRTFKYVHSFLRYVERKLQIRLLMQLSR